MSKDKRSFCKNCVCFPAKPIEAEIQGFAESCPDCTALLIHPSCVTTAHLRELIQNRFCLIDEMFHKQAEATKAATTAIETLVEVYNA